MRLLPPGKRRNLRRDVNGLPTAADFTSVGHCDEHYDTDAAGVCRDCRRRTCEPCQVEVRRLGTLCTHCALVRAGLRSRHRVRH